MRLMPKNSEAWTLWLPACHALLFQKRANNLGAQMNGISFPPHLESLGRYNLVPWSLKTFAAFWMLFLRTTVGTSLLNCQAIGQTGTS